MTKSHTSVQPELALTTEQLKEFAEKILQLRIVIKRIQPANISYRRSSFTAFIEFGACGDVYQFLTALNTLLTTKLKSRSLEGSENIKHVSDYNQSYLLLTESGLTYLAEILHQANTRNIKLEAPVRKTPPQPAPTAQTNQAPSMPRSSTCTIQ